MKTLKLIIALLLIGISANVFAQQQSNVPHAIKYQAVARDSKGDVIPNQNVSFRISIVEGSESGTTVYQETQSVITNQFGLANLSIGKGNAVSGNFNDIQWGVNSYFVKVEFDPKGGNDFSLVGTSQMLSVPYALYSEKSSSIDNFPVKAALKGTNLASPFANPETGMLVYNTDSAGTSPNNVIPGYYYNAGTPSTPNWVLLSKEDKSKVTDRVTSGVAGTSTNTTYGGLTQDAPVANWAGTVGAPTTGVDNTGFGTNALNSITTGSSNTSVGYDAMDKNTATANTAVGDSAMYNNTSGFANAALGYAAMVANTTGQNNTAVGYEALFKNTTGTENTASGYTALYTNTTGTENTAYGYGALYSNTGSYNTAIGFNSLGSVTTGAANTGVGIYSASGLTTGGFNVAVGTEALQLTTTASSNTAIGYAALNNNTADYNTAAGDSALFANTSGIYNCADGYQALALNTTAGRNVAVGYQALYNQSYAGSGAWNSFNTALGDLALSSNQPTSTTNGYENTAAGYEALTDNTTGYQNTAVGLQASISNTTGIHNTTLGYGSAYQNKAGTGNVAVGYSALFGTSGDSYDFNTAVGDSALIAVTTGGKNTGVGYKALQSNTSGTENTAIGYGADVSATLSNQTAIGYNASVTAANCLVLGSNVYVGIGVTAPTAGLDIGDGGSNTNCHIRSDGSAPAPTLDSTGGGHISGVSLLPSSNNTSTDTKGLIKFTGFAIGIATVKIVYSKAYNSNTTPVIVITPFNAAAATYQYYVESSANNQFYLGINGSTSGGGTTPIFSYFVIE